MATINPTPITPLPTPVPTTQDPVNFDARADAFLGALPLWGDQLNAMGAATYTNALEGFNYSEIAKAAKDAALASENAALASKNAAAASQADALASKNAAAASQADALASKNAAAASASAALASENAALASENAAANSASESLQYRNEAEVFARTQIVGTSTTSLEITGGQKTLTTQANKAFSIGQYLVAASQANFTNRFSGLVSSYNPTTGQLVIEVSAAEGSGIHADWSIAISAEPGESSDLTIVVVSSNTTVVSGVYYILNGNYTLTLPLPASITPGFKFGFSAVIGGTTFGSVNWNGNKVKGKDGGTMNLLNGRQCAVVQYGGTTTIGFVEV